jgi:hypothetical protein
MKNKSGDCSLYLQLQFNLTTHFCFPFSFVRGEKRGMRGEDRFCDYSLERKY